jgi:hydroxymethylpyrimidine pyrophosphatase-like HAD family hydrolase
MAFGDYFNDVEMLNEAYFSYAMANAPEGVKEHARFIAKSNIENGVVNAIKDVVLKPMNKL